MPTTHLWQPELLDMSQESHRIRWESLKASGTVLEVHDTLDAQVAEWAAEFGPSRNHLGQLAPNLHRRCRRWRARRGSLPTSGIGRVAPGQTNLHGPS